MADINDTRTTYNQASDSVRQSMDEVALLLNTFDVPLTRLLASRPVDNYQIDWGDDELLGSIVTPDATSNIASTTISVSAADSLKIRPNDILMRQGGTVQALVTAVNHTTGDLTVIRPYAGTVDEQLLTTHKLVIIGQGPVEGADPQPPRGNEPTKNFNYTSIYQEGLEASRTARKSARWWTDDIYMTDAFKGLKRLGILHERHLLFGVRHLDGATKRRSMGGLNFFLASSPNNQTGTVDSLVNDFNELLRLAYENGGNPRTAICSPKFMDVMNEVDADLISTERTETVRGHTVRQYQSPHGQVTLVEDRHLAGWPQTFVIDQDYIERGVLDDWMHEFLAKTGDATPGQLIGEFTLKVKNPKAHGILTTTDIESV